MAGATTFAAALDARLRNPETDAGRVAESHLPHVPTLQAFIFEFAAAFASNLGADSDDSKVSCGFRRHADFGRTHADDPSRRPANHSLSPQARSALDRLNALGAGVAPDFSAQDLRKAFRTLARRYHPDRHPACSAVEKATLSRQFIQLHDAYRELQVAAPVAA